MATQPRGIPMRMPMKGSQAMGINPYAPRNMQMPAQPAKPMTLRVPMAPMRKMAPVTPTKVKSFKKPVKRKVIKKKTQKRMGFAEGGAVERFLQKYPGYNPEG